MAEAEGDRAAEAARLRLATAREWREAALEAADAARRQLAAASEAAEAAERRLRSAEAAEEEARRFLEETTRGLGPSDDGAEKGEEEEGTTPLSIEEEVRRLLAASSPGEGRPGRSDAPSATPSRRSGGGAGRTGGSEDRAGRRPPPTRSGGGFVPIVERISVEGAGRPGVDGNYDLWRGPHEDLPPLAGLNRSCPVYCRRGSRRNGGEATDHFIYRVDVGGGSVMPPWVLCSMTTGGGDDVDQADLYANTNVGGRDGGKLPPKEDWSMTHHGGYPAPLLRW